MHESLHSISRASYLSGRRLACWTVKSSLQDPPVRMKPLLWLAGLPVLQHSQPAPLCTTHLPVPRVLDAASWWSSLIPPSTSPVP